MRSRRPAGTGPSPRRLLIAITLALACHGESSDAPAAETERSRVLGPFLAAHWQFPVPPQGATPEGWSEAEASLDPALCGGCHPKQFAEWSTSLHAGAFSPGFAGQLIEGALAEPHALRGCQECHAPLAEQQPVLHSGEPSRHYRPELRSQGLVCAVCHVRAHQRFGPPRRDDAPLPTEPVPHGGFEVRPEYQESRFCSPCHQFFDDAGPNDKSVENTFKEWEASPHAREGKTCQSCHMPDRAHLWRGIHDANTVREAVHVELVVRDSPVYHVLGELVLESREIGHYFPTYVTPHVFLETWQLDAAGARIESTRLEYRIARDVDFSSYTERSDTRVPPHGSARLAVDQPRAEGAVELFGRVRVEPDHFYRGLFEGLLPNLEDAEAQRLIREARRRSIESSYVLVERRQALD